MIDDDGFVPTTLYYSKIAKQAELDLNWSLAIDAWKLAIEACLVGDDVAQMQEHLDMCLIEWARQ